MNFSNDAVAGDSVLTPAGRGELIGIISFLIIFAIGNYVLPFGRPEIHWWTDLFWTTGAFLTALKCFAAARGLKGSERNAWRLFGLACFAWFLGMLVWDVHELLLGELAPFPSLSDVGYYLFAILSGLGFLYYRSERLRTSLTLVELSQFGIFLVCVVLVHQVIFAATLREITESSFYIMGALAYPVLYMGVLIYCMAALWLGVRSNARYSLGFVLAGITAHAVADSLYAYELLGRRYEAGNYLDIIWLTGFGLIYWGAVQQRHKNSSGKDVVLPSSTSMKLSRLVPVTSIGITILIVIAFGRNLDFEVLQQLSIPIITLMMFIALREWAGSVIEAEQAAAVRNSETLLRQLFTISPAMISITRRSDGHFYDVNEAYTEATGYSRNELIGKSSDKMNLWNDSRQRDELTERLKADGTVRGMDVELRTKSGQLRHILASFTPARIGADEYLIGIALDLTERHSTDEQMRKLSRALEQTADTVMITDRSGTLEYVNPSFEMITGYSAAEAIGRKPSILHSGKQREDFYRTLWETILKGEVFSEVFVNMNKAGNLYYEQKTITPLRDNQGMITHFVATGRDISERMEYEERLRFLAHHDAVTTLPNRTLLLDHLKIAIAGARTHNRQVAVVFLDIDRFKNINDTLGHDAGDALLLELGARLHNHLRGNDSIARFGGDEFVIVMNDLEFPSDAAILARRILENLTQPFSVTESLLHVSASIGIAFFPNDGDDSSTLLKNADAAMFRAKEMGGSNYQFYSAEMGAQSQKRLTLENSLRLAVERGEFVLHYQPLISARSGKIIGCEALLRWQHPEQGLVLPLDFIPLLEETGLIVVVGRWVIETACAQLAAWHRNGHSDFTMAINIASRQFHEPELVSHITNMLQQHYIEPHHLELEITESTLMQYIPATAETLNALSRLGVHIALDDFGTGYSSLSYLRRFPIDTLKIDRSFVRDIPGDKSDCEIARAIIALAQTLNLRIVAEGVETAEQRQFLTDLGCDVMQGYFFSQPVTSDEFERLIPGDWGQLTISNITYSI